MKRSVRLIGLLLALIIGVIGCTDRSPDPPSPSPNGSPEGSVERTTAEPLGDAAEVKITKSLLTPRQQQGGVGWPQVILLVGSDGSTLASFFLEKRLLFGDRSTTRSITVDGRTAVVRWNDYLGAGFSMTGHVTRLTYQQGRLRVGDRIVSYDHHATAQVVVNAARTTTATRRGARHLVGLRLAGGCGEPALGGPPGPARGLRFRE